MYIRESVVGMAQTHASRNTLRNTILQSLYSTIITGLMIGATYSISIVATSNTLPSTETTDDIGNMITVEYYSVW